jgi:L-ribulose-5-phosphate 4-epimerase
MKKMNPFEFFQQQVVRISQEMTRKGYLMGTGGNVSVRVAGQAAGQNVMAITPSNFDYTKMKPEDVCVVDWELNQRSGRRLPSIESGMHAAVYQTRPEVNVIIHTHQITASAVALLGKPIPSLFDEQVRYLGRTVDMIPYGASGTGWLKHNIVRKLKNHCNAYILQNHGSLTLGPDPDRAMFNVDLLEKCATAYLLAYYTGERVSRIPLPIREVIFSKLRKDQQRGEEKT